MTSADDIDDKGDVMRAVKAKAARLGRGDNEVLDRLWNRNDMTEESSLRLAVEAQHRTRPQRR